MTVRKDWRSSMVCFENCMLIEDLDVCMVSGDVWEGPHIHGQVHGFFTTQ